MNACRARCLSTIFAFMLSLGVAQAAVQPQNGLRLSASESRWLKAHPDIVLGVAEQDWAPFEFREQGQVRGYGIDYLQALARKLGVRIKVRRHPDLESLIQATCAGSVDVIMNVALTSSRTRCMVFTDSYLESPVAVVGRQHDARASEDPDLRQLRLVIEEGFPTAALALKRYPGALHLSAKNTDRALHMVAEGDADVYLGNPYAATRFMDVNRQFGLRILRQSEVPVDSLHFAVPNSKQPLAQALDAAMLAQPPAELQALRTKWLPEVNWGRRTSSLLNASENAALSQPLRLGMAPDAAPISFVDSGGAPDGLAEEYLRRFRALGATLNMVPVKDWAEIREKMRRGELDAVIGVPDDAVVDQHDWMYSRPFLTIANVIVTKTDAKQVLDMQDLSGRRIALSDPDRLAARVLAQASDAKIVRTRSAANGLELVQSGDADAYIGNLAIIDHLLRERHAGNLQIAAPTDIEDRLALGVRQNYAPLITSFDRMLMSMSPRERQAIRNDWLAVEYRSGLNWKSALRWGVPLLLVVLTAMIVQGVGHWRLRREVNERRRAERRLAEVTDNLPAVVYQFQWDTEHRPSFPFIAGDMGALFGIDAEQAMLDEAKLFARVHPEDQSALKRTISEAAEQFLQIDTQFRALGADGWRWIRSCGTPYRADDGSTRWSGYWIDITQAQAQSEALADAKAAAEQAAAAKGQFLATMSHEIRTPMAGIVGMLEMLRSFNIDDQQAEVLGAIEDSAQMLRQILDDILDFSKMEANALVLTPTPTDLRVVLGSVREMFLPQALSKGVDLKTDVDGGVGHAHCVDPLRLKQVLFNLTSNAIKFTERGAVSVLVTLLGHDRHVQQLRISVIDTGIGISEESQQRLFQPFTQAEATTSRRYGGTGLGLTICQKIIEAMQGTLTLSSRLGQGTKVHVRLDLPLAETAKEFGGVVSQQAVRPKFYPHQRILVVEDHPTNQALMMWRLKQMGLNAVLAEEGGAALKLLQSGGVDLVITDCQMPGMDGFALARQWRLLEKQASVERLPIIALTAGALAEQAQRCIEAGMDEVLVKPITLQELWEALQRWLPVETPTARPFTPAESAEQKNEWQYERPRREVLMAQYGDALIVNEILASLDATLGADVSKLRAALASSDATAVHDALHRIAGVMGAACTPSLGRHLSQLSHLSAMKGIESCGNLQQVLAVLEDYLRCVSGALVDRR